MKSYKITGGLPLYFKRFCQKDGERYGERWGGALNSPFWQGGRAYATDGRVMIWPRQNQTVETGGEIERVPDMQRCIDGIYKMPYDPSELRGWPTELVTESPRTGTRREHIGPCWIGEAYAKRIRRLGNVRFAATGGAEDPLYFETSRVCGVIMPLSPDK